MDRDKLRKKGMDLFRRYRYALLVVGIGLVLMLMPSGKAEKVPEVTTSVQTEEKQDLTQRLELLLGQIEGAGKVKVLLSLASGEQVLYQTDIQTNGDGQRQDTVLITGGDRNQTGLIQQVKPPTYLGAVVVCQGADRASVRLAVVDAVSKLTGLGADKISVLKMK
jgi:stage III sporulation protein AG